MNMPNLLAFSAYSYHKITTSSSVPVLNFILLTSQSYNIYILPCVWTLNPIYYYYTIKVVSQSLTMHGSSLRGGRVGIMWYNYDCDASNSISMGRNLCRATIFSHIYGITNFTVLSVDISYVFSWTFETFLAS